MPMGTDQERLLINCPRVKFLGETLQKTCRAQDLVFIYAGGLVGGHFPQGFLHRVTVRYLDG